MEFLLPLLTLILLCSLGYLLFLSRRRQEVARERALRRRILGVNPPTAQTEPALSPELARTEYTPYNPPRSALVQELERWLVQGGVEMPIRRFVVIVLLCGLIGGMLADQWFDGAMAVVVGLVFALIPGGYVFVQRKRRLRVFAEQLPYVLDFLRTALGAGHPLLRGVQMASESAPEPIGGELRLALDQIRLGSSLPDALESMFKRVPEQNLAFLVVAIRVQAQVGSGLAEILNRVTDAIRSRQQLEQEVQGLTAQAR